MTTNRLLLLMNRILAATGDVVATPSGVNVDLQRGYGKHDSDGLPHYAGNRIPV